MSDPFKPCGWPIEPGATLDLVTRFNADSEADKLRAEIASLRAQLDEARTLLADVKDHFIPFLNWAAINEIDYDVVTTCDRISALLSESKT